MKFISLLFRSKKTVLGVLVVIALLVVQAYCELELPNYTSGIVDVGIMQDGVENAAPTEIRETSMQGLGLFMTESERETAGEAYENDGERDGVLKLKSVYADDKEKISELNDLFKLPMLIGIQLRAAQDAAAGTGAESTAIKPNAELLALIQKIMTGQGTDADVEKLHESVSGQMEEMGLGDTMIASAAVEYVKAEYEEIGLDMQKLQTDYMVHTGLIMGVFTLIACAAAVIVGLLASLMSAGIGRRLRRESFERIMSFSNTEMDKFSPASLITRSTNDIQQIQMAMVFFLRLVLFAPAMAVGGIIMVGRTDTGLSWIIVAAIVVLAAVIGSLLGLTMPKFQRIQPLIDNVNLVSREILTGLPVIRAFCREDFEKKRFDKANVDLYKTQLFTNRAMMMFFPLIMFVMNIVMLGIVWFGGKGIDAGDMQVGDLMAFMSYAMFIVMAFMMLSMVTIMLPRASVAARRVLEVIHTDSTVTDKPKEDLKDEAAAFKGLVEFHDVSFRYHDADEDTLSHISFAAEPGKTTAIIGGTGSGKSTLINLIPRLFDVTGGSVTIDGIDVRDLSQHKLRSLMGFVPQKGVLFSGTIESNLKFAGPEVSDGDMRTAAEIAQASDFIAEKEGGYESEVSQGGTNVSGGQRQRLSIARAIAKHPKVLIFDDSFSALDFKTDSNLRRALVRGVSDSALIIVAQRIATILRADRIIVLEDGEIVGAGTHEELMKSCGIYREIAVSQLSEDELSA